MSNKMWIGTELYNGSFGKFYTQNDLDKILDVMISEFDIYYRGSSDKVSKEILYEKFCFRISESSDKFIIEFYVPF